MLLVCVMCAVCRVCRRSAPLLLRAELRSLPAGTHAAREAMILRLLHSSYRLSYIHGAMTTRGMVRHDETLSSFSPHTRKPLHADVEEALMMLRISDFDEDRGVLSFLPAMCNSAAHARIHCREGICEYACVPKELLDSEQTSESLMD